MAAKKKTPKTKAPKKKTPKKKAPKKKAPKKALKKKTAKTKTAKKTAKKKTAKKKTPKKKTAKKRAPKKKAPTPRNFGFVDTGGRACFDRYELVKPFQDGLACVQLDGLWGAIDREGTLVIEPRFSRLDSFDAGMAPAKLEGTRKVGYVDRSGDWVIEPSFDYAMPFVDGYGTVNNGGSIPDYAKAFATIPERGKWGVINADGELVIDIEFAYAESADGFVLLNKGGSHGGYGVVTGGKMEFVHPASGRTLGPYASATLFGDGLASVRKGKRWSIIDESGTKLADIQHEGDPTRFSQGRATLSFDGSAYDRTKYVIIDSTGAVVLDDLGEARAYSEGMAAINVGSEKRRGEPVGGKWGYADLDSNVMTGPWSTTYEFGDGLGLVWMKKNSEAGFINKKGELQFSNKGWARPFSEGFACVRGKGWFGE